ncbi:MAG: hypothetical protein QOD06_749 [Candidatus Binatota bacterium]|nr:hypothetical protein [Candidatus Binatota bacterium]
MKGRDPGESLVRAAVEILQPLVERMLAAGIVFGRLESQVRDLFVQVAEQRFAIPGRPQTDSRLALLTGINRKEIRRIRSRGTRAATGGSFSRNVAADVCSRWSTEGRWTDRAGHPLPLSIRGRTRSFVRLVRETTADVRPKALLDELVRAGAVELRDDRTVVLSRKAYIPATGTSEKLTMLAEDPPELVRTMIRNVFLTAGEPWLQQKVAYDHLGSDGLERVRREIRRRAERFLDGIDRYLSRYDRDRNARAPGGERRRAGLGVYYFESEDDETPAADGSRRRHERDDDDASDTANAVRSPPADPVRVRRRPQRHGSVR